MSQYEIESPPEAYEEVAMPYGPVVAGGYAQSQRLSLVSIFVGVFILATVVVGKLDYWNYLVKALGVIMAFGYAISSLRARLRPPPEAILYVLWAFWSLSGLLGGAIPVMYWDAFGTVLQIWVLLLVVSGFTSARRALTFNLAAFLVGAAILAGYSYLTGEYRRASEEGERVAGLALNANAFAWVLLLAVVAMAYLWMLPGRGRVVKYVALLAAMVGATAGTILSGSRKAIVAVGLFYVLWLWFCYRKLVFRRIRVLLVVVVLVVAGSFAFLRFAGRTPVAERFRRTWEVVKGKRISGGGAERIELFKEGLRMIVKHPIVGLGLNNFRVRSTAQFVSHSEYIEIACGTGVPGFFLYFAIFVILWRRAGKIAKYSDDPFAARIGGFVRAFLLVIMALNFGRWNYRDKEAWLIFGSLIGYTHAVWLDLRSRMLQGPLLGVESAVPGSAAGGAA